MPSGMVISFKKARSLVQDGVDVGTGGGTAVGEFVGCASMVVGDGEGKGKGAGELAPEQAVTKMPIQIKKKKREQMDLVRLITCRFSICFFDLLQLNQFGWRLFALTGLIINCFIGGERKGYFTTKGALPNYGFDFIGDHWILA